MERCARFPPWVMFHQVWLSRLLSTVRKLAHFIFTIFDMMYSPTGCDTIM